MHPYSSNRQTQPILGGPRGICAEITIGYPRRFRLTAFIYVSCEGVLIEWYGRNLVVVGRLWRFWLRTTLGIHGYLRMQVRQVEMQRLREALGFVNAQGGKSGEEAPHPFNLSGRRNGAACQEPREL